jgi:RNA polymerase sigma-70 factor, ECF subfamily
MATSSQDAFADCFLRFQARVYAYIVTLLSKRSDAEEVFQQTSLTLWRRWDQYDPDRDFVAWACGIAHNEVRNFLRHSDRRRVSLTDGMLDLIANTRLVMEENGEERLQALRSCLESLPRGQSRLIEARYEGGEAASIVAKRLGLTKTNLYVRLHRIRRALVECIERRLATERKS